MSEYTKHLYTLSTVKQLIDINKDVSNFKCSFTVSAQDSGPFEALIVSQTDLDTQSDIPFQQVNGSFSGEIVADKNVYQNYFLILRSNEPRGVEVELSFEKLPEYIPGPDGGVLLDSKKYANRYNFRLIVGGLIALAILYFLYKYYNDKKTPKVESSILDNLKNVSVE